MPKTKRARHTVSTEARINAAQEKVVRQKARYDNAVAKLEELLKQRERLRQKELMAAIDKSDHTFEEIGYSLEFVGTNE